MFSEMCAEADLSVSNIHILLQYKEIRQGSDPLTTVGNTMRFQVLTAAKI